VTTTTKVPGRLLVWTALGASVLANVAFARAEVGLRLTAGTAPVLVVLAAGLLERVPFARARWWQRWLAGGGLVFVVLAAFVTSYQHQHALLIQYGNPELSATLLPFAVDALVIMSSISLAVIAERRRELAQPPVVPDPVVRDPEIPQASDDMVSVPRPARRRYTPSAADRIRKYADAHPTASVATIAKRLNLSERTVRRHLAGTNGSVDNDAVSPIGDPASGAGQRDRGARAGRGARVVRYRRR
jgi:hypothetical protein